MFGYIDPDFDFFGLIGRVTALTAVVELRLWHLTTALHQKPQEEFATRSASDLVRLSRDALATEDPASRALGEAVLERVRAALDRRNAVVHSVYPSPTPNLVYGWRGWQPVAEIRTSERELRGLITELVALGGDLGDLMVRVW